MTFERENIGLGKISECPKFSTIIATYNRKDYLLQAIQSVVEQTYPAHEIIVVVDGSTDGSAATVRHRFPDVNVIEQPNLGRSIARNTGVAAATGDWICFLDDDDLWHCEKLARTRSYILANPLCQAANNPVWYFAESETGPTSGLGFRRDFVAATLADCHREAVTADIRKNDTSHMLINGRSYRSLLERNLCIMSAAVVRRDTLIRAGCFPPMYGYSDDWGMFTNVARITEWHLIPDRLGFTRLHATQSTSLGTSPLAVLLPIAAVWYGGRPLPQGAGRAEILGTQIGCAHEYKRLVQNLLWRSLFRGNFRDASAICKFGWLLLPRLRDRVYATLPPQITWRFERYILGMHKCSHGHR
ncbi:MAG: glycosyltransferase family A protein [Planctomycetia bacterium]|nr:glycosyltransferase family A protein [Planctomycetia bacterium]